MVRTHYIYKITNLQTGISYIGQRLVPEILTIENDPYMGGGTVIRRMIKKHGRENFKKEILEICHSRKEADRLEEYYFQKFGVYTNPDKFYNIGLAGQFWRNENHSEFMSNIQKEFYSDPERKKQRIDKYKKSRKENELKKKGIEFVSYENYLIEKEKQKEYNLKIKIINKQIKKIRNDYYLFMRKQTDDLRQEFYNEKNRQKQLLVWSEKKKEPEFLKAVREGKKKCYYKEISKKCRAARSAGHAKRESIIYIKLWENNLSVNKLKNKTAISRHLDLRIKTHEGLIQNINTICTHLKNDHGIIIDFNELYTEALTRYSGRLIR